MKKRKPKPNKQGKQWVHIWFWCLHISIALVFASENDDDGRNSMFILFSLLSLFMYCIAIGRFASQNGRSGLLWGGLSLLLSPLGVWISYLAGFFIKVTHDGGKNESNEIERK